MVSDDDPLLDVSQIQSWHILLCWFLFFLTIFIELFIAYTSWLLYKNKDLLVIKLRWPRTWLFWTGFTVIYSFSRLLFSGFILGFYPYDETMYIITTLLRTIGLNGTFVCLLIRAWLFYITYKYDQEVLEFKTKETSWVIRHKSIVG